MSLGDMARHQIAFQAPLRVPDSRGGFTTSWTTVTTVYAETWTVSSQEKDNSLIRVRKFKVRYRKVMQSEWRILYAGKYFNIASVDPDKNREFMFITCKEVA